MLDAAVPLIDDDTARFIEGGVSVSVAARDHRLRPSLVRACGLRLAQDRRLLRILVVRAQAEPLLADVLAHGRVAVVLSEVTTHRTLQIKSMHARVEPADAMDRGAVEQYEARFAAQLDAIGYAPPFVPSLLGWRGAELAAIVLQPDALYSQTPGPRAGVKLRGGA